MQYTKQQRAAIAAVFKAARKILWNGKDGRHGNVHICDAIIDLTTADTLTAAYEARKIIMHRLGHHSYAEGWLYDKGCIPHYSSWYSDEATIRRIQKWRKEWLRRLEKEFSS